MKAIEAQEIKRHGISFLDKDLKEGPVHIIKNNKPCYVVLTEECYQEILEIEGAAYKKRIKKSLDDVKAKKIKRGTAQELIKKLGLED